MSGSPKNPTSNPTNSSRKPDKYSLETQGASPKGDHDHGHLLSEETTFNLLYMRLPRPPSPPDLQGPPKSSLCPATSGNRRPQGRFPDRDTWTTSVVLRVWQLFGGAIERYNR